MKKIINHPETVVSELCHGLTLAHPELSWNPKYNIISRSQPKSHVVSLISGGGSGHEPAHAGFVGTGMLDAAVCGDIFASPSQFQIYKAIQQTDAGQGVLLIIKNYSGDVMNFQNAAYLAQEDGIRVDYVKVDDDIAVQDSQYTVGRRGVAGTIFVHKIAGAAAERGYSLPQVKAIAVQTAASVKTIGFALTSCTVPAKGTPTFSIADGEMEYGAGIHGEPGIRREPAASADELAARMVPALLKELALLDKPDAEIAVLVNGLGGTPVQELYVLNRSVQRELRKYRMKVHRTLVGNYMTSLDMAGASLSILALNDELRELLDAPCDTAALKISGPSISVPYEETPSSAKASPIAVPVKTNVSARICADGSLSMGNIIYLVDAMSGCIIRNEKPFCELDAHAGDGDFGMSVAKGFRRLKSEWQSILAEIRDIGGFLSACALVIMEHCGGASGPVWGAAFRAAGRYAVGKTSLTKAEFAQMLQSAVTGIQRMGERSFGRGAGIGDKTLMDALIPCADTWLQLAESDESAASIMKKAAAAAVSDAKETEKMVARMGRAGTVGKRSLGHPDAGAYALGVIFTELAEKIQSDDQ